MKKGSILIKSIISIYLINSFGVAAFAQSLPIRPSFPSCKSPQGALKVSYSSGTHGVPGDYATYKGNDAVYTLSESTLTQCLCTTDGQGVQTNWWKISSLSFEEIEALKKLGWIYVPDGSLWGLQEGPYMAQSGYYNCSNKDNGHDDDDDDDDDHYGDSKKQKKIGGIGQVLGASTYLGDVLGLASTGNTVELVGLASLAIGSLGVLTYFGTKRK